MKTTTMTTVITFYSPSPPPSAQKPRDPSLSPSLSPAPTPTTTTTTVPTLTLTPTAKPEPTTTTTVSKTSKTNQTNKPKSRSAKDQIPLIQTSPLSPFQKSVLLLLCQVPSGRFTTYGVLAAHLSSSPRAVGNALRRNPFAPAVPCHRVVATGGELGGFKGKVGRRDGKACLTLQEKRSLLRREGVKFDADEGKGGGRVVGVPFVDFV